MASCTVCRKNKAQYACSHVCHTLYCSPVCAELDWSKQHHYLACGDFLDDYALPKPALVQVLSNFSFEEISKGSSLYERFADVINTYSFRKTFAVKHKGEWEERVNIWFSSRDAIDLVEEWVPVLLETNTWNPAYKKNFAIVSASEKGWTRIVKLLLADSRVDPTKRGNMALFKASTNGHADIVKLLLADPRVDPTVDDYSCFTTALQYDWDANVEVVRAYLEDGRVDPGIFDNFPLIFAARNGSTRIVKLLLQDKRVNPRARNDAALKSAIERGYTEIVEMLQDAIRRGGGGAESETKRLKLGQKIKSL